MSPLKFLLVVLGITFAAAAGQRIVNFRRRRILANLANQWQMHFVARDRFHVALRVCACAPTPGAADVRVMDVIYGMHDGRRVHLFTCEFGVGTIHSQSRRHCVAAFAESAGEHQPISELIIAPDKLPRLDQYRWVKEHVQNSADEK